jgi:hypothetical protein
MVDCWKFWSLHNMHSSENRRGWQLVYEGDSYSFLYSIEYLRATIALCAVQPSCWYHIRIRFLSSMSSKRRGRMFNKNAAYVSAYRSI